MTLPAPGAALPDDGYVAYLKAECPTCQLVAPLLGELGATVVVQDEPGAFDGAIDDTALALSFAADVEAVPTLVRRAGGAEVGRTFGWSRADWRRLTGRHTLGADLPELRAGCGSKTREPNVYEHLVARFGAPGFSSRAIAVGDWDDPVEACFDRGWTDGLPVVPPTDARILRMLDGTARRPGEVIGRMPPDLAPLTVEKVAINAVMAGCRPEYMPVLLAAIEAALKPVFTLHGVICTTCFSSPVIIVNGPIARRIGMNSGINALGQGNRANATIGRALNLIIRNVGGGRPGELDRSTIGGPGKYTFCFAENEADPRWQPLAEARGIAAGRSAVTLFQGDGIQGFIDWKSRTPQDLSRSLAMSLLAVGHPKLCEFFNAVLVLSPEHHAIFADAGWDRARIEASLRDNLRRPGRDLVAGAHGVGEGMPADRGDAMVDKFWPEGLLVVRAGGAAGLYSAICCGWTGGRFREESQPVTIEIAE
ncbi:thioredoxin [Xanthobacter pseudotagetidis]|uniref:thioredoxin n=1 Tax=Xanthobacter pseudotagetidis TaxID=3119911 RepID=UPI00372A190D